MNFFDMGMGEILLVIVVALIIFGPAKIPEIARTLGALMGTLRKTSFDLTTQIKKELELEDKDTPSHSKVNSGDKASESPDAETPEVGGEEKASPKDQ
ncbi:Sec-independent protein translocase protein TatB [Chloroflexota bacterium]